MTPSRTLTADRELSRKNFWAGLRWGAIVTLFLMIQLGLAYSAITYAASDGGARPIPGADEEIARSYAETESE